MKYPYVSITPVEGSQKLYKLVEDITFEFDEVTITLPKGFRADGATIPQLVWTILGVHPLTTSVVTAAFIHDLMYTPLATSETFANALMMRVMRDHKLGKIRSFLIQFTMSVFAKPWYSFFGTNSVRKLNKLAKTDPDEYHRRQAAVNSMITWK